MTNCSISVSHYFQSYVIKSHRNQDNTLSVTASIRLRYMIFKFANTHRCCTPWNSAVVVNKVLKYLLADDAESGMRCAESNRSLDYLQRCSSDCCMWDGQNHRCSLRGTRDRSCMQLHPPAPSADVQKEGWGLLWQHPCWWRGCREWEGNLYNYNHFIFWVTWGWGWGGSRRRMVWGGKPLRYLWMHIALLLAA